MVVTDSGIVTSAIPDEANADNPISVRLLGNVTAVNPPQPENA